MALPFLPLLLFFGGGAALLAATGKKKNRGYVPSPSSSPLQARYIYFPPGCGKVEFPNGDNGEEWLDYIMDFEKPEPGSYTDAERIFSYWISSPLGAKPVSFPEDVKDLRAVSGQYDLGELYRGRPDPVGLGAAAIAMSSYKTDVDPEIQRFAQIIKAKHAIEDSEGLEKSNEFLSQYYTREQLEKKFYDLARSPRENEAYRKMVFEDYVPVKHEQLCFTESWPWGPAGDPDVEVLRNKFMATNPELYKLVMLVGNKVDFFLQGGNRLSFIDNGKTVAEDEFWWPNVGYPMAQALIDRAPNGVRAADVLFMIAQRHDPWGEWVKYVGTPDLQQVLPNMPKGFMDWYENHFYTIEEMIGHSGPEIFS